MIDEAEMAEQLASVRERIATAARRVGREPGSVRLVLASKTQPAAAIRTAYRLGARDFGENYVQEAVSKRDALADLRDLVWHLIGHLQTNKARVAAGAFAMIQSVDSVRLAAALARIEARPPVRILVEVNLAGETSKTGAAAGDVARIIEAARGKLQVEGLMTIPPPTANPELARPYFARLRAIRDCLAAETGLKLSELSMGMTDDFEVAIEEGATIVRVGRAVFGERTR